MSLTVTEGGYSLDPVTSKFDMTATDVVADALPGVMPRTTFGLITEVLQRRRDRGLERFTVMSCDNIARNGDVARRMFTPFARLRSPDLGAWIADNDAFPK